MKKTKLILIISLYAMTSCGGGETTFLSDNSISDSPTIEESINTQTESVYVDEHGKIKDFDYQNDDSKLYTNGVYQEEEYSSSRLFGNFTRVDHGSFYGFNELSNKIKEPKNIISSRTDLAYCLDYGAFYHQEYINVSISSSYIFEDIEEEINLAFRQADILSGVVGLDMAYDMGKGQVSLHLLFNQSANSYASHDSYSRYYNTSIPYTFYSNEQKRDPSFSDFGYLKDKSKQVVDVYNSDQLLFALENNYIPTPILNSPSEKLLNAAKSILNEIIYPDMSEMDKHLAIMCWLNSNARYDYYGDEMACFSKDAIHTPDEVASSLSSFYAEGALLDGKAVCHGFSKAYNILVNMEGITSRKINAYYEDIDASSTISSVVKVMYGDVCYSVSYSAHGYSYVLYNGKYFISDPTFNLSYNVTITSGFSAYTCYRLLAVLLPRTLWDDIYSSIKSDWFSLSYGDELGTRSDWDDWRDYFIMKDGDVSFTCKANNGQEAQIITSHLNNYINNYNNPSYLSDNDYMSLNLWGQALYNNLSNIDSVYSLLSQYSEPLNGYTLLF